MGELCEKVRSVHQVWKILLAAFFGGAIGIALSANSADERFGTWLGMPGYLYLRALKLLVVPLVFCSVVTGVASLQDLGVGTGKLGGRTVGLYALTTVIGVIEGLVVTYALYPAWKTDNPARVLVEPRQVQFDAERMITVRDTLAHGYFNSSYAVRLRLQGAPDDTAVEPLFWYESSINFVLPVVVGAAGPYTGWVESLQVLLEGEVVLEADGESLEVLGAESAANSMSDSFVRLLDSLVPDNLVAIFGGGSGSPDLLSLIVFAVVFAAANMVITNHTDAPDMLTPFFQETLDTVLYIVLSIVAHTPLAVGALILRAFADNSLSALATSMRSLGIVVAGWVFCFAFHTLVTMPSLAWLGTRQNPYPHLKGMAKAATLAFGCASSAVTLPVNMACCERLGYQPAVVRFVLSLGATVSMDGTAIFIPGAVIWLADQAGIALSGGNVVVLAIIATLSSAGASPTPGLISIVILCWASVFPSEPLPHAIAYLAAVDWFIDRCVTTTNVLGDSFVVRIISHLVRSLVVAEGDSVALAAANKRAHGKHKANVTPISSLNNLSGRYEAQGTPRLEIEMSEVPPTAPGDAAPALQRVAEPTQGGPQV